VLKAKKWYNYNTLTQFVATQSHRLSSYVTEIYSNNRQLPSVFQKVTSPMRCVNFFVTSAYNSDRTYSLSHFIHRLQHRLISPSSVTLWRLSSEFSLTSLSTQFRSFRRRCFTGLMTQPAVSKHWRRVVSSQSHQAQKQTRTFQRLRNAAWAGCGSTNLRMTTKVRVFDMQLTGLM